MTDWTPIIEPEKYMATDTTDVVDLHSVLCSDCNEPMDTHGCPSGGHGSTPATVLVRSTGPRKKATDHPACDHCGGRMHWSAAGAVINFDCMYRQFCLATGLITDPNARLPLFVAADVASFDAWVQGKIAAGNFSYGKMSSAGGGAGTYSALRPVKTAEEKAAAKEERAARRKAAKSVSETAAEVTSVPDPDAAETAALEAEMLESPAPHPRTSVRRKAVLAPRPAAAVATTTAAASAPPAAPLSIDETRRLRREERQKRLRELQAR